MIPNCLPNVKLSFLITYLGVNLFYSFIHLLFQVGNFDRKMLHKGWRLRALKVS